MGFFLKTRGLTCALRGLLASSEDVFNKWCLPKSNGNVQTACKLKFLVFLVVPEKKHRHVPLNLSNPVPGLSLDDGLFVDYAADAGADWLPIARKEGFVGQTQTCYADAQGVCLWQQGQGRHEHILIEGSLEVKLPTIWTDEKQSREEAERRERSEERRVEEKESEESRCRCAKR